MRQAPFPPWWLRQLALLVLWLFLVPVLLWTVLVELKRTFSNSSIGYGLANEWRKHWQWRSRLTDRAVWNTHERLRDPWNRRRPLEDDEVR